MFKFIRPSNMAVIREGSQTPGEWYGTCLLNAGVAKLNGRVWLYYRGPVGTDNNDHAIGVMSQQESLFDPYKPWDTHDSENPVKRPSDFDSQPSPEKMITNGKPYRRLAGVDACEHDGKIYVFSQLKDADVFRCKVFETTDGTTLNNPDVCKDPNNNILSASGAGIISFTDPRDSTDKLLMMHTQGTGTNQSKVIRTSTDGVNWSWATTCFTKTGVTNAGDFNDEAFVTTRLLIENGVLYAFCDGGGDHTDYPEGIGLYKCAIDELFSTPNGWEAYPMNPVLLRGPGGSIDEGGVWSPAVVKIGDTYHMFYEGCGAYEFEPGSSESVLARDTQYGGYFVSNFSQICHAVATNPLELTGDWDAPACNFEWGSFSARCMINNSYVSCGANSNGTRVKLRKLQDGSNSLWEIRMTNNEFFEWKHVPSGKVMEIKGRNRTESGQVDIWTRSSSTDNEHQDWHLIPVSSDEDWDGGAYYIQNRNSGLFLSAPKSMAPNDDDINIQQLKFDGSLHQRFYLNRDGTP